MKGTQTGFELAKRLPVSAHDFPSSLWCYGALAEHINTEQNTAGWGWAWRVYVACMKQGKANEGLLLNKLGDFVLM